MGRVKHQDVSLSINGEDLLADFKEIRFGEERVERVKRAIEDRLPTTFSASMRLNREDADEFFRAIEEFANQRQDGIGPWLTMQSDPWFWCVYEIGLYPYVVHVPNGDGTFRKLGCMGIEPYSVLRTTVG